MPKEERVQPLHYCRQAIEQLEVGMRTVHKDMPGVWRAHHVLLGLLRESVKFILPNRAELIAMGEVRQAHLDLARLPFPVVALESPWVSTSSTGVDKPECHRSTKRIALCVTMGPALAELLPDTEQFLKNEHGGVVVFSVYWDDATSRWTLPMGGLFIPRKNEVSDFGLLETDPSSTRPSCFDVTVTVLMPEKFDRYCAKLGYEQSLALIIKESRDEAMAFLQASVMLNCANVRMVDIGAPALLSKGLPAKGQLPSFSYRVLQVESPTGGLTDVGGHHAHSRGHLRRGHIRKVQESLVWIRPAFVSALAEVTK
jgi:hypothetical protein